MHTYSYEHTHMQHIFVCTHVHTIALLFTFACKKE